MKLFQIEIDLKKQGMTIFSSREFRRAAGLTAASSKLLLIRYVKRGWVLRLKDNRGLYCLRQTLPHPWHLANRLLLPSYISLESALAHYGLIPETVYAVTSVSPKTTRTFQSMDRLFTYQKIKSSAFTGYRPLPVDGRTVLVAEPEKALVDYLYFVHLKKKSLLERIRWSRVRKSKIVQYAKTFGRDTFVTWIRDVIA